MEQDKLDKLFRGVVHDDHTDLSEEEQSSKEAVWNQLDLPSGKSGFDFWKVSTTVLFLILGASMILAFNIRKTERERYSQLKMQLSQSEIELQVLKEKVSKSNLVFHREVAANMENSNVENSDIKNSNIESSMGKSLGDRLNSDVHIREKTIEKIVVVYDTVWVNANQKPIESIKFITDTIYLKVLKKEPMKFALNKIMNEDVEELADNTSDLKKIKRPSKIEFIFNEKKSPKSSIFLEQFPSEQDIIEKQNWNRKLIIFPN